MQGPHLGVVQHDEAQRTRGYYSVDNYSVTRVSADADG